ncbi:Spy/CpxP family protein refolding chaperone [Acidisphaera sp. L21]|jgi:protein CpxP|uniref:Spy/CpxP family protein refolding chaperone n=1 Tax=Acidisphaera sp. L21 TaxID=1641851 RepID=UPI00131D7B63|nr:Spy/CpxP family protein refolding chaperone [Acidisphaera sp. L21]
MDLKHASLPVLLAGLLLAAPVFAQPAPAPAPTAVTPVASKPGVTTHSAGVERRIKDLHTRLKITATQEKSFDDFANVLRDNDKRMSDMSQQRQQAAGNGTAVDQMQSYADWTKAHADDVQRMSTAFGTLYNALTPDQKNLADQSFRELSKTRRTARG